MPDESIEATGLPEDLEDRVYKIFSDVPMADRDAAVAGLLSANAAHVEALQSLIARLRSGDQVLTSVAKDVPALADPERVGAYRILRKLGEGGFGVVYLAEQEEPVRREVALKLILPGMDSRRVLDRFEAERQALARMDHPCIAKVFDAGVAQDHRPFFAMEYAPGEPITRYCDARNSTIVERIQLVIRVGEGVQHAHQKGIVHRDLKPSNILVFEQDERAQPKIIDFGIAKAMEEPLTESTLATMQGHLIGTPEYMSPEQADAELDIDTRTDIYSLAVILYELLVGDLPIPRRAFRGKGLAEIQRLVGETEPILPSRGVRQSEGLEELDDLAGHRRMSRTALVRALTGDIDWILLKALAKDREERYASASEFMDDLRRFLNHEPVLAGPPSVTYRMRKFVRRYRTQVGAACAILLALVIGLIVSTSLYQELQDTHTELQDTHTDLQESHTALAASRVEVAKHLGDFRRLEDVVLFEELRLEAEGNDLHPSVPSKVPAFKAWKRRARSLVDRMDQHDATLASLRKTAKVIPAASADAETHYELPIPSDQFLHDQLTTLVANVEEMQEPWGFLWSVERRLAWAETVEQETIGDHADDWARAIRAIRENPKYGNLQLRPQLGLIPVGADPRSSLYEFFLLRSGDAPKRGADGLLDIADETGIVLVLIPGGAFLMGRQNEDPEKPNYDKRAHNAQRPVVRVELDPFFLSKYEMTQGQWLRLTGSNPSNRRVFGIDRKAYWSLKLPVQQVSSDRCERVLWWLGLRLPTEAQWEYACRAGTSTCWHAGDDLSSLIGYANIADASVGEANAGALCEKGFRDGYIYEAPVGSYKPNLFGLHDMHGNVTEFVRDGINPYGKRPRPGDGFRGRGTWQKHTVACRGGSYRDLRRATSSFARYEVLRKSSLANFGVRPMLLLQK